MPRNILVIFILSLFLLIPSHTDAQYLRLNSISSRTDISFDLSHLYNYNVYEQNRWGAGFFFYTPLCFDENFDRDEQNNFTSTAYMDWGTGDHALKYGATASLIFPRNRFRSVTLGFCHDLELAGTLGSGSYNIFKTSENFSYLSSRFSAIDRIWLSAGFGFLNITLRHSREQLLFNNDELLFPMLYDDDSRPRTDYNEMLLQLNVGKHWVVHLLAGVSDIEDQSGSDMRYGRILGQYSNTVRFSDKWGSLRIMAKLGNTFGKRVPVSRLFNLGGTGGSNYYFSNSMLTVRPNEAMANRFVLLSLHYSTGLTLWSRRSSNPTPFVQLNAIWGALGNDYGYGETCRYILPSGPTYDHVPAELSYGKEDIYLISPYYGIFEPAIGIDNLIRWGMIDFGLAAAYKLTPKKSLYYSDNFSDNFSVMLVAKLMM